MITSLNAANSGFLANLNAIKTRMDAAQKQIASGLKIANASDSPDQISELLSVRANLAATQTISRNLGRVKTETDTAETALEQASTAIQNAQVAGAQGASSSATAATRATLATQIGDAISNLVGISRTTVEGRYIFSGDNDQTPPYSVDFTQVPPIGPYLGSATATRQAQAPDGSTFPVAQTAQQLFDPANQTKSVFNALSSLQTALTNNDTPGITAALDNLGTASSYFQGQLALYGNVQNKVASATTEGSNQVLNLQAQVSNIQEADLTQSILELQQAQTAQTAALQSKASIVPESLFSFLK